MKERGELHCRVVEEGVDVTLSNYSQYHDMDLLRRMGRLRDSLVSTVKPMWSTKRVHGKCFALSSWCRLCLGWWRETLTKSYMLRSRRGQPKNQSYMLLED